MKVLSVNMRGMGGGGKAKRLALKQLVELEKLDILLIQETMGMGDWLIF
jgi:hypothetical protein